MCGLQTARLSCLLTEEIASQKTPVWLSNSSCQILTKSAQNVCASRLTARVTTYFLSSSFQTQHIPDLCLPFAALQLEQQLGLSAALLGNVLLQESWQRDPRGGSSSELAQSGAEVWEGAAIEGRALRMPAASLKQQGLQELRRARGRGASRKGLVQPEQREVERTERWSLKIRDVNVLLRLHTKHSGAGLLETRGTVLNPPEAPLGAVLAMCWGCWMTKGVFIWPVRSSAGGFVAPSRKGMPVPKGQGLCQLAAQ